METFQFYFELIGAAAFAISGAALGIRKEMDLFGVAMLGMTTAVGGGMLRDTMLGLTPPAALRDPVQALVAIAVSILVFFVWRRRKAELHNRYAETVLLLADSLGLGIFSAHGAAIAIQAGYGANWFLVLFMGMLTGVGGGVSAAVASGCGSGHDDRLRCDAGAAHLRRSVPLEPAQSIKNSGVTRVTPLFFVP